MESVGSARAASLDRVRASRIRCDPRMRGTIPFTSRCVHACGERATELQAASPIYVLRACVPDDAATGLSYRRELGARQPYSPRGGGGQQRCVGARDEELLGAGESPVQRRVGPSARKGVGEPLSQERAQEPKAGTKCSGLLSQQRAQAWRDNEPGPRYRSVLERALVHGLVATSDVARWCAPDRNGANIATFQSLAASWSYSSDGGAGRRCGIAFACAAQLFLVLNRQSIHAVA